MDPATQGKLGSSIRTQAQGVVDSDLEKKYMLRIFLMNSKEDQYNLTYPIDQQGPSRRGEAECVRSSGMQEFLYSSELSLK